MIIKHYKMLLEAYKSIYPKSSQPNWLKLEISPEDLKSINQDLLDFGLIETTKEDFGDFDKYKISMEGLSALKIGVEEYFYLNY